MLSCHQQQQNIQCQLAEPAMQLINASSSSSTTICSLPYMAKEPARPELLRSTIFGTLRPGSPVLSPSISASPSFRTETSESGRYTPASTKQTFIPIPKDNEVPELARSIDLICFSNTLINQETVLEALLSNYTAVHEHHSLFELPVTVRRRIYDYCLPDEPRKISLSPRFVTKAVFPDDSLASPWDVLEPVRGGLQAFSELRRELMTYFWTQFHFHVTLSPFTGPRFSPLSHVWLRDYLNVVQYLSVEADLTRFGFGTLQAAAEFGHNVYKTETLMIKLVKGLIKRRGKTTMAEFNVMCRRYDGFRPCRGYDDATFNFEPVPYCPHESLFFCDAVCDLRGILHKSRVSGFTQEYTETLLRNIFTDGDYEPCFIPAKDCAWPPLPIRPPGDTFDSNHALMSLMSPCQIPPLRFTPTSSFTEEIEDEMLKYESSVYSEKIYAEEPSVIEGLGIRKLETTTTLADQAMSAQNYEECVGSIARSNSPIWSSPRDSDVNSRRPLLALPPAIDSRCAMLKSQEINQINAEDQVRLSDNDSGRRLLAATPTLNSRAPTPQSPNEMNRRNEQDPAFVRTVDALRSLDCDNKPVRRPRPMSMIPSPVRKKEVEVAGRSQTSLGTQPRSEGTVRRYLSFVKKLRGREN